MKNLFCFVLLLSLLGTKLQAQSRIVKSGNTIVEDDFTVHLGLKKISPEAYLKIEQAKMTRSFSGADVQIFSQLPEKIDLSGEMPTAAFQGEQNSCTGWALGYAVKSMQENRELGWGLTTNHLFSPSYIYNQANAGVDEGAYLIDAIKVLQNSGAVPMTLMPYQENDFRSQPSEQAKKIGQGFRALGYRRLNEKDVNVIKSSLAAGEPVVLIVEIFQEFLRRGMMQTQAIYKDKSGSSYGAHAIVAVGYDDSKKAIKILNSWGPQWGDKGYGWIDYELFPQVMFEAYVIYDTPTPEQTLAELESRPESLLALHQSTDKQAPSLEKGGRGDLYHGNIAQSSGSLNTVLIVPEEAGIVINEHWLRLGDPLSTKPAYLSKQTATVFQDFNAQTHGMEIGEASLVRNQRIGKMYFTPNDRVSISTNQGLGFGSAKSEVRRILNRPDTSSSHVNALMPAEDHYFYHSSAVEDGGVASLQHAHLSFRYDEQEKVTELRLEWSVKDALTGKNNFAAPPPAELSKKISGTLVQPKEHQLEFIVPDSAPAFKKIDWELSGSGYFFENDGQGASLVIKILNATQPISEPLLQERITADLQIRVHDKHIKLAPVMLGGIKWELYRAEDAAMKNQTERYFAYRGQRFYQLIVSRPLGQEVGWIQEILQSMRIY